MFCNSLYRSKCFANIIDNEIARYSGKIYQDHKLIEHVTYVTYMTIHRALSVVKLLIYVYVYCILYVVYWFYFIYRSVLKIYNLIEVTFEFTIGGDKFKS